MFWVYFLYSQTKHNIYVGCTKDIEKRFQEHQKGFVKSTKNRRPLILFHRERFNSFSLARKRERYLKSLYGCRERQKIFKEFFKN